MVVHQLVDMVKVGGEKEASDNAGIPWEVRFLPPPEAGGQPVFDTVHVKNRSGGHEVHGALRSVSYFCHFQTMVSVKIVRWMERKSYFSNCGLVFYVRKQYIGV